MSVCTCRLCLLVKLFFKFCSMRCIYWREPACFLIAEWFWCGALASDVVPMRQHQQQQRVVCFCTFLSFYSCSYTFNLHQSNGPFTVLFVLYSSSYTFTVLEEKEKTLFTVGLLVVWWLICWFNRYEMRFLEEQQRLRRGDKIFQIAFGSGFKCNSAVWTYVGR